MVLTIAQLQKLKWLHERGGSGYIDRFGRVCAAGEHLPVSTLTAWLNLFVNGMIAGGEGRLWITELGLRHMRECKG